VKHPGSSLRIVVASFICNTAVAEFKVLDGVHCFTLIGYISENVSRLISLVSNENHPSMMIEKGTICWKEGKT
jgi:hypothetical protein